MMTYMTEGGYGMWLMLVTAIGIAIYAFVRPREARPGVFLAGCIVALIEGMAGLATGMEAVASKFDQFPDKAEAIGIGLGELANNGTLAVVLATFFGLASLLARGRSERAARAAA